MEEKMKSFEDLNVWQISHNLVLKIYNFSKNFPKDEIYGLTLQIRKTAVSVPANIAEGFGRINPKEMIHFYNISLGSISELKYFIILIRDLNFIDKETFEDLNEKCSSITKMLQKFIKSIKKDFS